MHDTPTSGSKAIGNKQNFLFQHQILKLVSTIVYCCLFIVSATLLSLQAVWKCVRKSGDYSLKRGGAHSHLGGLTANFLGTKYMSILSTHHNFSVETLGSLASGLLFLRPFSFSAFKPRNRRNRAERRTHTIWPDSILLGVDCSLPPAALDPTANHCDVF